MVENACGDSRLVPVRANGSPAFGFYKATGDGDFTAFAIQVLEVSGSEIAAIHTFIDPSLFARFGLSSSIRAKTRADDQ
jgi:RNA polymerase sigma-70 factor (ECF subfamily)